MNAPSASPFQLASAVTAVEGRPGVYVGEIPDGWQQGRGAFGGLVLGTLLRAMGRAEPDPARLVRTITGDICGPVVAGPIELRVQALRRGNNQSNWRADLHQGDQLLASASAIFSTPRTVPSRPFSAAPPAVPPFGELPVLPVGPPLGPIFAPHFEFRARDSFPFTGGPEALVLGTIRERTAPSALDAPALVALLDSYWPSSFAMETSPRLMTTISFAAQLFVDPASLDPETRFAYRGRGETMSDGFFVEYREIWAGDRLVGLNQQTFALLK